MLLAEQQSKEIFKQECIQFSTNDIKNIGMFIKTTVKDFIIKNTNKPQLLCPLNVFNSFEFSQQ